MHALAAADLRGHPGDIVVFPHMDDPRQTASGDDAGPGEQRIAFHFVHRVRFTGQQRFIHFALSLDDDAVAADLLSAVQHQHIIEHDILDRDALFPAVPDHLCLRDNEQRELIHHLLGMQLLRDADDEVEQDDEDEHHVRPCADQRQRDRDQKIQQIEQREDVFLQYLRRAFGSGSRQGVFLPVRCPFLHLTRSQTLLFHANLLLPHGRHQNRPGTMPCMANLITPDFAMSTARRRFSPSRTLARRSSQTRVSAL